MAAQCAGDAHDALIKEKVLLAGECADPSDLSVVADTVWTKTGSQAALVDRLPLSTFRNSEPNDGYLAAAALLRERALASLVTLNYDLTISRGLELVSSSISVEVLAGPWDHGKLSVTNVIYLHRNVDADPDSWVMRTVVLQDGWRDGWEEMIASAVLVAPITLFVGLGSPAAVLIESSHRIRTALKGSVDAYQIDPAPYGTSKFTAAIGVDELHYIRMGWSEFMAELGLAVLDTHLTKVIAAADELADREHFSHEDVAHLCARLSPSGLVRVGRMRAAWFLDDHAYASWHQTGHEWTADILLGVRLIERVGGLTARLLETGPIEFDRASVVVTSVFIAHGRGAYRWPSLEARARFEMTKRFTVATAPKTALLFGYVGGPITTALPASLIGDVSIDDLVLGPSVVRFHAIDELRADESIAKDLAS